MFPDTSLVLLHAMSVFFLIFRELEEQSSQISLNYSDYSLYRTPGKICPSQDKVWKLLLPVEARALPRSVTQQHLTWICLEDVFGDRIT